MCPLVSRARDNFDAQVRCFLGYDDNHRCNSAQSELWWPLFVFWGFPNQESVKTRLHYSGILDATLSRPACITCILPGLLAHQDPQPTAMAHQVWTRTSGPSTCGGSRDCIFWSQGVTRGVGRPRSGAKMFSRDTQLSQNYTYNYLYRNCRRWDLRMNLNELRGQQKDWKTTLLISSNLYRNTMKYTFRGPCGELSFSLFTCCFHHCSLAIRGPFTAPRRGNTMLQRLCFSISTEPSYLRETCYCMKYIVKQFRVLNCQALNYIVSQSLT